MYVFTFFLRFFQNPKKHDFLRFFELLHTFSRTVLPDAALCQADVNHERYKDPMLRMRILGVA